jgi:hypothetical protein
MSFWVAGATLVGSYLTKTSADKNASRVDNLQYQPIDLEKLQNEAQDAAKQNYLNSMSLEAQGQPDVAATRAGLSKQVSGDLASEGNLPIDVQNKVTRSAITGANSAGFQGAAGPVSASSLGLTSMDVRNQNQAKAASLLAGNPLPQSGLDPGALASADVANQNAMNWFNVAKTGALGNANQSSSNANAGLIGALGTFASKL